MAQYQYQKISSDLSRRFATEDTRQNQSERRQRTHYVAPAATSSASTASRRSTRTTSRSASVATTAAASSGAYTARTNSTRVSYRSQQPGTEMGVYGRSTSTASASVRSNSGAYRAYSPDGTPNLTIIEGTAARVLAEPERRQKVYEDRNSAKERKAREKRMPMNLSSVMILGVCVIAMVGSCIFYLSSQNELTVRAKNVATLQKQYEALAEDNDAIEMKIAPLTDYSYVYKVATEELGMQVPTADQIKTFDKTENEYVVQYDQVPSAN